MTQQPSEAEPTESLLRGLIAECGEMVRTQLRPGMEADDDAGIKWGYAKAVSDLVKIAAQAGEAVARLRGGGGETRHRVIVQRLSGEGAGEG